MSPSAAPTVIAAAAGAESSLAVRVHDGHAELARARLLSGTARELVAALGPELAEPEVVRWLLERGARDEASARTDARSFLAELSALEPLPVAAPGPAPSAAAAVAQPPEAWTALARAVLGRGYRLRFRAFGRSMRPLIPHGSLLEVEPRAFAAVRLGEVVLHAAPGAPLVAHRVVGRAGAELVTRGDSNARLDRVGASEFLGVVVAREHAGRWRAVSSGPARWLGLCAGLAYRLLVAAARVLVLRPLRATYGGRSLVRAFLRGLLRGASAALLFVERAAVRLRRPLDVLRAALFSTPEKERDRSRLYQRKAIQEFTALAENVRSGLTLLEEVLLARHPLQGRVLVLGCGPGRECLVLARRGLAMTGLDREAGMLARAEELARAADLAIRYVNGEAHDFRVEGGPFDAVLIFSGLQNMLLPRARRVAMLRAARAHLRPGGSVLVTFLSAYLWPGEERAARGKHVLEALNPEHERGDLYLLNEAVHVYPHADELLAEAREAGLEAQDVYRDQRAYDRASGQVRGYAVLRRL
ncbi:MAG: methyltransferase domain-containing protein [Planctomycetes bacterium]|nr:methyltransferase domain-containing protein [Planctomycetota bacterium]